MKRELILNLLAAAFLGVIAGVIYAGVDVLVEVANERDAARIEVRRLVDIATKAATGGNE